MRVCWFRDLGAFVALAALLPSLALAEAGGGDRAADRERAAAVYEEALREFNLGQFDNAVEGLTEAYRIYPHASFLFNIGQCHSELDDHERAIFFYRRYLAEAPDAENRDEVESLIAAEETALEEPADDAPTPGEEPTDGDTVAPVGDEASPETTEDGEPAPEVVEPRPIYREWWFWTLLGVVVAGAVAGTALGMTMGAPETVLPDGGSLGRVDWR